MELVAVAVEPVVVLLAGIMEIVVAPDVRVQAVVDVEAVEINLVCKFKKKILPVSARPISLK
jgi:hypothetical protein